MKRLDEISAENTPVTEKMVEEVNSVNPDVVVIAGDIFTSNYDGLKHPEKYKSYSSVDEMFEDLKIK